MKITNHKMEIFRSMDGLNDAQLQRVWEYIQRMPRRQRGNGTLRKSKALEEIDLALSGEQFAI